jgi:hypothetical protein
MPLLLGIYHKANRLDRSAVQPMIDAFGGHADRFSKVLAFPGFVLVAITEIEGELLWSVPPHDQGIVAVVGTVVTEPFVASPVEAFAQAWRAQRAGALPALEGAFAACAYDPQIHQLHVVNDKFGIRPMFVCETPDYFAFCSEFAPLLLLPGFRFRPDHDAIAEYFCLGTTLGGHTFAEGIRNLAPATCLSVQVGKQEEWQYWQPNIAIDRFKTVEQHAAHLTKVMREVVPQLRDQLTNARCLLTAGADSRLILSCLKPAQRQDMLFMTSNISILAPEEDKDVIGASELAQVLGLAHEVLQWAYSEHDFGSDYFDETKTRRWAKIIGGWHGGEFLGGYCKRAAPIRTILTFSEVDATLRSTFSWWFRRKLKRHPFETYQAEIAAVSAENREFYFQIQQMTRGFFTNIYNGSRGSWLQPYELVNQGFSPFWDSRFLQAILQVPFELVADYQLYNVIFRECLTELNAIPSNSLLTMRSDSALVRMTVGTDPKVALKPKYQNALNRYNHDKTTWQRRLYRKRHLKPVLDDGDAPITMRFIDFEAWWRKYAK